MIGQILVDGPSILRLVQPISSRPYSWGPVQLVVVGPPRNSLSFGRQILLYCSVTFYTVASEIGFRLELFENLN